MKKTHRNILIVVAVVIVLAFIVVGILNGWFRASDPLSTKRLTSLNKVSSTDPSEISNASDSLKAFSTLWREHVKRTREYILSSLNRQSDIQEKESALLQNQKDIANEIDKYYPGSYALIADALTQHILIAKEIIEDLKNKRLLSVPGDINKWYSNADEFSDIMQKINSNWKLKLHMHRHLLITEYEVIQQWLGFNNASKSTYENKIVPQAQDIANKIVAGLYPGQSNAIIAPKCPSDKPYPITEFGGKWTGECQSEPFIS